MKILMRDHKKTQFLGLSLRIARKISIARPTLNRPLMSVIVLLKSHFFAYVKIPFSRQVYVRAHFIREHENISVLNGDVA